MTHDLPPSPTHRSFAEFFFEGFYQHANTSIETTKSFSTLQPVHWLKGGQVAKAKGFNYAIFVPGAIQSSSLCTPGHPT